MELKIKFLNWAAGSPVAMLSEDTAKEIGVRIKDRISIETSSKEIITIVDIIGKLIKKNEIAVSSEIKKILNLKQGQKVDVNLAEPPESLNFIKKKLNNKILSKREIRELIDDIVNNSLSEAEVALFVSSMYKYGMNIKETIYLIESILKTGNILKLKEKLVADKHSIGGVAGRTTPIIVAICTSAGLIMPKNSSRAITSPCGTADAMETVAKVDFKINEIKKIIHKTNGCIVWGGSLGMVPADSKIINVEKMLHLDPEAQLLASIMSKKLAAGSNYIIIHIPYGKSAKVNRKKAIRLKKKFYKLGKYFNKKIKCVLTKSKGPLGNGIGPSLEMIDVVNILDPNKKGPSLLEERSLVLAGELLELTGKAEKNKGKKLAEDLLFSGKAFKKFKEIVKAQKGNTNFKNIKLGKFKKDIYSNKTGKISEIDNKKINSLAIIAGCPTDKNAGVYLHSLMKDKIKRNEKLITIYSESKIRLKEAEKFYRKNKIIKIK
jgi:putative thymidine phosphorylase